MAWSKDNGSQSAVNAAQYIDGKKPLIEQAIVDATEAKPIAASAKAESGQAKVAAGQADTKATDALAKATSAKTTAETVQGEFDRVVAEAGSNNPEVVQARGSEATLKARLDKTTAQLADTTQGMSFARTTSVSYPSGTAFTSVDVIKDKIYAGQGSKVYSSPSVDGAFTLVKDFGAGGSIGNFRDAGDGEILLVRGNIVYRTNGWGSNPSTATLTQVLETGGRIAQFGFAVDPVSGWCLVSNYINGDMSQSRWAWLSKDRGKTWNIVFDMATEHPTVDQTHAHMHVCAIDTYVSTTNPRLWLTYHKSDSDPTNLSDPLKRIIYSDDGGIKWNVLSKEFIQPVIGIPTKRGMVFDTDGTPASLYVAERTPNPADMKLELLHQIRAKVAQVGWANKAVYGENGAVHIAFRSSVPNQPGRIISTDGYKAAETLAIPPATINDAVDFTDIVVHRGRVMGVFYQTVSAAGTAKQVIADEPKRGIQVSPDNTGIAGGVAGVLGVSAGQGASSGERGSAYGTLSNAGAKSVSVGYGANSVNVAVSIGNDAVAGDSGTAVGEMSSSEGGVSIGRNAKSISQSTAIGYGALAQNTESTAVGVFSNANGQQATALGSLAEATGQWSAAFGRGSKATALGSVAMGRGAQATHQESTAIGAGITTTAPKQIAVGDKHIEAKVSTTPVAPAVNTARYFFRADANGKVEWCVRFPTGDIRVIASEVGIEKVPVFVTGLRPSAASAGAGGHIFDTTLGKPIWSDGTNWKDAIGTIV